MVLERVSVLLLLSSPPALLWLVALAKKGAQNGALRPSHVFRALSRRRRPTWRMCSDAGMVLEDIMAEQVSPCTTPDQQNSSDYLMPRSVGGLVFHLVAISIHKFVHWNLSLVGNACRGEHARAHLLPDLREIT